MMKKRNRKIMMKKLCIILGILLIISICALVYSSTYPLKNGEFDESKTKFKEKDYVAAYCKGEIDFVLPDKTRVDCLSDEYAIEFDFGKKWAEAIGQSLYYAKMTGKKPAIALILNSPKDKRFIERINTVDKNIMVFEIKSKTYQENHKTAKAHSLHQAEKFSAVSSYSIYP